MAHWNDERDARWVKMLRDTKRADLEPLIKKFEETGDLIYWSEFIDTIRAEHNGQSLQEWKRSR